ncbi:MAG: hypothetical protein KDB04_08080 [Acidimicrobiales bacterium]|mgnify:CR=1 FL=1|nr:hypothetical protein [Acidimicrobiales bacterium]HRW39717.1 hypothetical protein [Aquihabitans sp.]
MGWRDAIRQAKEAMAAGMGAGGPTEEQLAAMSPEQRAVYEAHVAEGAAERAVRPADPPPGGAAPDLAGRPLRGPAGEWLYNPSWTRRSATGEPEAGGSLRRLAGDLIDDAVRPIARIRPPDAPPPAPEHERAAVATAERAERDRARSPYLAPQRAGVMSERIPTRSGTELDDVAAYLASSGLAARPDLVFGCYRVPDHHEGGALARERDRYVEWEVVHAAGEGSRPAGAPPEVVTIDGATRWVERVAGEASVLDEDLAIAYLAAAGIGPDRTLGLARALRVRSKGADADGVGAATIAEVTGIHVLHVLHGASGLAAPVATTFGAWAASTPIEIAPGGPPGVHVEVLNWLAVAAAVWPQNQEPAPVPSAFGYLPSSAQELLGAYLEVVGVHPAHCYGASVVEDRPRSIDGTSLQGKGFISSTSSVGAKVPCADGSARRRLAAGAHVVIAYLDTPTYADGRARWDAYQRDVLRSDLAAETGARRPVVDESFDDLPAGLGGLVRGAKKVARAVQVVEGGGDEPAPHRYCWPPAG